MLDKSSDWDKNFVFSLVKWKHSDYVSYAYRKTQRKPWPRPCRPSRRRVSHWTTWISRMWRRSDRSPNRRSLFKLSASASSWWRASEKCRGNRQKAWCPRPTSSSHWLRWTSTPSLRNKSPLSRVGKLSFKHFISITKFVLSSIHTVNMLMWKM